MSSPPPPTICGGATPIVIPGRTSGLYASAGALALLLERFGHAQLAALAGFIGGFSFVLPDMCLVDPPPDQGITLKDVEDVMGMNGTLAQVLIIPKFQRECQHLLWQAFCECPVSTPPPPGPWQPPSGAPIPNNPTVITAQNNPGCFKSSYVATISADPAGLAVGTILCPVNGNFSNLGNTTNYGASAYNYPPLRYTVTNTSAAGGQSLIGYIYWFDSSGTNIHFDYTPVVAPGQTQSITVSAFTGYSGFGCGGQGQGGPAGTALCTLEMFCGGLPQSPNAPCCEPDATTADILSQLLDLSRGISRQLISANGLIAMAKGATHTGLSGSGTIGVSDLVGMLIDITAGVPTVPQLPGNPPYQWDLGWISIMTPDGMIDERRITRQGQIWAPQLAPLATTFGYYLFPGVVATFTELQAG